MCLSLFLAAAMALHAASAVLLHWQAPPKSIPAVTGYNVYRQDSASAAWVKINTRPVRSPHYKDHGVLPGHSYSYSIRSLDAKGHESAPSAPWSVTIPAKGKHKLIEAGQP